MARIRRVDIQNFRGIRSLSWVPAPGVNCLIGSGDSGKSSVLDAIDLCLGARRNLQLNDTDFYNLDVTNPIAIEVTVGQLDDSLKSLESYGLYLRSFNPQTGSIEDEPEQEREVVLTVRLTVAGDLEPAWTLVSARAVAQGVTKNLNWSDRVRIAPTRIGAMSDYHLGWRRGSVLNHLSEERADATAVLAKAARDARAGFGDQAQEQLQATLTIVADTAKELGIHGAGEVTAMLDAHSISIASGTISLHEANGVPLRSLGTGSTRLLIAGLQRKAAAHSTIILVDELEYGLEPHRIIRLLGSLGAKEREQPLQVFATTHSPVAIRELSGSQLYVIQNTGGECSLKLAGVSNEIQSTIRLYPEAFLAKSVLVCEGASEVGLIRGLDLFRCARGSTSFAAHGTALVDSGGGPPDRPYSRAAAFRSLGYRTAVLRDDDQPPPPDIVTAFIANGGTSLTWRHGRALEDELFLCLSNQAVLQLVAKAVDLHGHLVSQHILAVSNNATTLQSIQAEGAVGGVSAISRQILGRASRVSRQGWFKSVTWMEEVASSIVGPDLPNADQGFREICESIFTWSQNGGV